MVLLIFSNACSLGKFWIFNCVGGFVLLPPPPPSFIIRGGGRKFCLGGQILTVAREARAEFLGTRPFNWSSKVTRGDRWCCYCQKPRNGGKCALWSILEATLCILSWKQLLCDVTMLGFWGDKAPPSLKVGGQVPPCPPCSAAYDYALLILVSLRNRANLLFMLFWLILSAMAFNFCCSCYFAAFNSKIAILA